MLPPFRKRIASVAEDRLGKIGLKLFEDLSGVGFGGNELHRDRIVNAHEFEGNRTLPVCEPGKQLGGLFAGDLEIRWQPYFYFRQGTLIGKRIGFGVFHAIHREVGTGNCRCIPSARCLDDAAENTRPPHPAVASPAERNNGQ